MDGNMNDSLSRWPVRRVAFVAALTAVLLPTAAHAQPTPSADGAPPIVTTAQVDKGVYVIGQDTAVTISATLPVQCAGTTATAEFYTRTNDDPTPIAPSRPVLQQESAAAVAANGAVSIGIPLPSTLEGGPDILFAGISDPSCLDAIVLLPRFIQIAVLDEAENPDGSATIVVPAAALHASPNNGLGTWAKQVGSITVSANGVECTTVSLTEGPAIDAEGNARIHIGTPDQPAACHEPNAKLTFVKANGQTFFEKYTLLPGVTQLLQNFANEPPSTSGTPTPSPTTTPTPTGPASSTPVAPGPPDTGTGTGPSSTPAPWLIALGALAITLSATGIALTRKRQ